MGVSQVGLVVDAAREVVKAKEEEFGRGCGWRHKRYNHSPFCVLVLSHAWLVIVMALI